MEYDCVYVEYKLLNKMTKHNYYLYYISESPKTLYTAGIGEETGI